MSEAVEATTIMFVTPWGSELRSQSRADNNEELFPVPFNAWVYSV